MSKNVFKKLSIICMSFAVLSFSFSLHATNIQEETADTSKNKTTLNNLTSAPKNDNEKLELQIANHAPVTQNDTTELHDDLLITVVPSNQPQITALKVAPSNQEPILALTNKMHNGESIDLIAKRKIQQYFRASATLINTYTRRRSLNKYIYWGEWGAITLKGLATFLGTFAGAGSISEGSTSSAQMSGILALSAATFTGVETIFVQPALTRMRDERNGISLPEAMVDSHYQKIMAALKEGYPHITFDEALTKLEVQNAFEESVQILHEKLKTPVPAISVQQQ